MRIDWEKSFLFLFMRAKLIREGGLLADDEESDIEKKVNNKQNEDLEVNDIIENS